MRILGLCGLGRTEPALGPGDISAREERTRTAVPVDSTSKPLAGGSKTYRTLFVSSLTRRRDYHTFE